MDRPLYRGLEVVSDNFMCHTFLCGQQLFFMHVKEIRSSLIYNQQAFSHQMRTGTCHRIHNLKSRRPNHQADIFKLELLTITTPKRYQISTEMSIFLEHIDNANIIMIAFSYFPQITP